MEFEKVFKIGMVWMLIMLWTCILLMVAGGCGLRGLYIIFGWVVIAEVAISALLLTWLVIYEVCFEGVDNGNK